MNQLRYKNYLLILLILGYVIVNQFVGFSHSHEFDGHFHDFCPACQFEIQAIDKEFTSLAIINSILFIPYDIRQKIYFLSSFLASQYETTDSLSRAPPENFS